MPSTAVSILFDHNNLHVQRESVNMPVTVTPDLRLRSKMPQEHKSATTETCLTTSSKYTGAQESQSQMPTVEVLHHTSYPALKLRRLKASSFCSRESCLVEKKPE